MFSVLNAFVHTNRTKNAKRKSLKAERAASHCKISRSPQIPHPDTTTVHKPSSGQDSNDKCFKSNRSYRQALKSEFEMSTSPSEPLLSPAVFPACIRGVSFMAHRLRKEKERSRTPMDPNGLAELYGSLNLF